jgi:hypothetical protein
MLENLKALQNGRAFFIYILHYLALKKISKTIHPFDCLASECNQNQIPVSSSSEIPAKTT